MKTRTKQIVKYGVKIGLSALALWFVFTKVNWVELKETWQAASIGYILLATLLFIISKVISAHRLNLFFRASKISLGTWQNIKLYWLGMYYNLFLPGGVGGDGYKVYLLRKSHGNSLKSLTWVMVLDRLGGLSAIAAILAIGCLMLPLPTYINFLAVAALVISPLLGRLLMKRFFPSFVPIYTKVISWSLAVQLAQVASALFLLLALGENENLLAYVMLFLISSVAAMLPISLGGLGAREIAMYYMAEYLLLNPELAMSISLAFYAITAIVSLFGGYYSLNTNAIRLKSDS